MKITEVGPRDGLQNEANFVDTQDKYTFVQMLQAAGLQNIECASFVKPEAVPQMSGSKELSMKLFSEEALSEYTCLVPNRKGYETALEVGYKKIALFTSPSDAFNLKNIRKTVDESVSVCKELIGLAERDKIGVRLYLSTVIHCPYSGKVLPQKVLQLSELFLQFPNVYEISYGETLGRAVPTEVERLLETLLSKIPTSKVAMHFHDTFGTALANVDRSLQFGIRSFDSSAGGLGGCPYAPGAAGNLATEDLVYFLENSGHTTGIDLEKLVMASNFISQKLGKQLPSKVYHALKSKCDNERTKH